MNSLHITSSFDVAKLLNFNENPTPDIIAIGFQEIVDLNATNILMVSNESVVNQWTTVLTEGLKKIDKYSLVHTKELVGLYLAVFAKDQAKKRISKVNSETQRAGLMNKLGNKGAVIIKLNFDDTSLVFTNCHLPSDEGASHDRIVAIDDIHRNAFQIDTLGKRKEEPISKLDYKFLIGDLNFRMNCSNAQARELIEYYQNAVSSQNQQQADDVLKSLFAYDEFSQFKRNSEYLNFYGEGPVTFLPTYKYDVRSDSYDTSKKQRTPAWCDRIFLWADETLKVEQKFYGRKEIMDSDHRPVVSYFVLEVRRVDAQKKEELTAQIADVLLFPQSAL